MSEPTNQAEELSRPAVTVGAPDAPNAPMYAMPPEPPPARGTERLRTVRTLVVAVVAMWVVLVGAWAVDRAMTQNAFASEKQDVAAARLRLAGVEELSGVFNEVNTAVEPAVVKLDVLRAGGRTGRGGRAVPEANSGSGVIVDAADGAGYVVTNNHVVANASQIQVTLADGRRVDGEAVGTDPESDLAVVKIEADQLVPAEWGDSDAIKKGDWVLAFGSPFNFVGSMTAGIVSALHRTQYDGIRTPGGSDAYQNYIQTDAAINPGNSGGPLVNVRGQIIGINSAIFSRTGDFSGIGFAIPSNQAKRVYADIRESGRFVRGYVGVTVLPADAAPDRAKLAGYEGRGGVIVTDVYRDTPAAAAGLRRDDVITRVGDTPVNDGQTLRNVTAFAKPGEKVGVELVRDGKPMTLPVTIGEYPTDLLQLASTDPLGGFGLTLQNTPQGPVEVASVKQDSPAADAGVRAGDVVIAVDRQPIQNARQAQELLAEADPRAGVVLTVGSGNRMYNLVLRDDGGK